MIKRFKLLFFIFLLQTGFISSAGQKSIYIPGEIPLGMAYDGRVLWVAEVKEKKITGYDFELNKITYTNKVRMPGIRDIAFWKVYLLSAYEKYLYIIDPITGNIVEKIGISELKDPSSIAVNENMAYIFDREEKRFFRYDMVSRKVIGSFPIKFLDEKNEKGYLRGATWFKDALWVTSQSNHLYKINPSTGEKISFLPVPENTYSIEFVDGSLYFASLDHIETLDFTETDYFIASKKNNFKLHVDYTINAPWNKRQVEEEVSLKICYNLFRMNPQQKYTRYKNKLNTVSVRRYHGGELRFCSEHKNGKMLVEDHFSSNMELRSTVFMLNNKTIDQFFKRHVTPPYPRYYTVLRNFKKKDIDKMKDLKKKWDNEFDGMHPYKMLSFLQDHNINDLEKKIIFFRLFEIPAREAVFYNLKEKKNLSFLQVYFHPAGWITVSDLYKFQFPKEFPVPEYYLELYYPETLTIKPSVVEYDEDGKKKIKKLSSEERKTILRFYNLQRQASE